MAAQRQPASSGASSPALFLAWWLGLAGPAWAESSPRPVAPPLPASSQARYQGLVSEGRALLKAHRLDEGLAKLSAAIQQAEAEGQPAATLASLYCLLGIAQSQAGPGERSTALTALAKAVALDPSNADCRLALGRLQLADKQYSPAKESAQAMLTQPESDAVLRTEARLLYQRAEVLRLFAEGRQRLKAHQAALAAQHLREAIAQAQDSDLAPEERSLLHYVRVLALRELGDDPAAIAEAQAGLQLTPDDADLHFELAKAQLDREQFSAAQASAQRALRLGLSEPNDQREAIALSKKAQTEALRERLSVYAAISFGYDSNVLQGGNVQTINGIVVTSARPSAQAKASSDCILAARDPLRRTPYQILSSLIANYPEAIRSIYACPASSIAEWDLPLTVSLELSGRFFRLATVEARLGYQFYQYVLTGTTFDHDVYNRQEHTLPVSLIWQPTPWLILRPHLDLVASFTGLASFTPYQRGLHAVVDATFIESRRLRTRLLYQHQLRRSFDRQSDAYLDADRDEVKLQQELRLRGATLGLRGQLSYRLRSERLGVLESTIPLSRELETAPSPLQVTLGGFTYRSPLSYLGHELSTRVRLSLPRGIELQAGGSFEYRAYSDDYTATFSPQRTTTSCPRGATSCLPGSQVVLPASPNFPALEMPATRRIDQTIGFDLAASQSLPFGFALDLSYALLVNLSTIANYVDNRSYSKHQLVLSGSYAF